MLVGNWLLGLAVVIATLMFSPHDTVGRVAYAVFYAGWWMIISERLFLWIFRMLDRRRGIGQSQIPDPPSA